MLDRLERADDAAELLALLGVGDGLLDHAPARAQRVGGEHDAAGVDHAVERGGRIAGGQRFGLDIVEVQFADGARRVDGGERGLLQTLRLGVDQMQAAELVGDDEDVRAGEIEHEQRLAGELAALRRDAGLLARAGGLLADRDAGDRSRPPRASAAMSSSARPMPAPISASGAITALATNGTGATCRPSASATSAASSSVRPRPPNSSGMRMPGTPSSASAFEHIARVRLARRLAHALERADALQRAVDALLHHLLVGGEAEFHRQAFAAFGSRGMPRPRSEMMFFWICAVPPPMIRPRSNM